MAPRHRGRLLTRPYLPGPLCAGFDAWMDATLARFAPPLTFPEIRKGVRAISSLYLERRGEAAFARALDGAGKRAAFACYYAPLHHLAVHHAVERARSQAPGWPGEVRRVVDLGCGTGALGSAVARALAAAPTLLAADRSGWALAEARHTLRAFGLAGRTQRTSLPGGLSGAQPGDLLGFGWVLNELADPAREATLEQLEVLCGQGVQVLALEPLAGQVVPWWDGWSERLARAGLRNDILRVRVTLPAFLAKMDRAAGLDHRELGARIWFGPL